MCGEADQCRSTFMVLRNSCEFSIILRIPPQNYIIANTSGTIDCNISFLDYLRTE